MILPKIPYIIAEVGSNWKNKEQLMTSISLAKNCGADAVKFQLWTYEDLYGIDLGIDPNNKDSIDPAWIPQMAEKANVVGIDIIFTAFHPRWIPLIDKYVKYHKIASSDILHAPLLKAVAKTGKPVFLSTAASSYNDIRASLRFFDKNKVILNYCVGGYPTVSTKCDEIERMRIQFGVEVGISDHSKEIFSVPELAIKTYKAVSLEKHVDFFGEGIESEHSLSIIDFKKMIDYINGKAIMMNTDEYNFSKRHNRRLLVIKDIKVGDKLKYGINYSSVRSLKDDVLGLCPLVYEEFNDKISIKAASIGDPITIDLIER